MYSESRYDIRLVAAENEHFVFQHRLAGTLHVSKKQPFQQSDDDLLDEWLSIEAFDKDWVVFRDKKQQVYLLPYDETNEEVFDFVDFNTSLLFDQRVKSNWNGKQIYGYCEGFFDREHFFVHEHTIEAVGKDWILARDTDENTVEPRVYLAYFNEGKMDEYLITWSSEEEKEEWSPTNFPL